mmetsp:Transcript_134344/g.388881  ORF Transcript_134344/g.388881 Transcript_134344/m.388881 type:complete len:472 (+) Transcript_134344:81-1496(+)
MDGMEMGPRGLTEDQQSSLRLFHEVTGFVSDDTVALRVLRSCNWDLEQAVQIALAGGSFARQRFRGELGGTLTQRGSLRRGAASSTPETFTSSGSADFARFGFRKWLRRSIRRLRDFLMCLIRALIFGPGVPRRRETAKSGQALRRALASAYGSHLHLPRFYEGSFGEALSKARNDLKLLVMFVHSAGAPHSRSFCTNILGNSRLRAMLDDSFIVWGGDVSSVQVRSITGFADTIEHPSLSVFLPASIDDTQLIGVVPGTVDSVETAAALLTSCLDDLEAHRASLVARHEQHAEDRNLRELQDREYQETLEMDRKRAEAKALLEREQREKEALEEAERMREKEKAERFEAQLALREADLRRRAAELSAAPVPEEATARISLRLPAGQRIERRFLPDALLAEVYAWAEVAPYLPDNEFKGLVVPERFVLKSSYPSRELTDRNRTVTELKLAGTNILLAAIEDDDDDEITGTE